MYGMDQFGNQYRVLHLRRNPGKNCSGHSTGANRPGSNDSGCSDQIRPPDFGIIKRYFRVPALQAVVGGASCLKMLPVSAES